MTEQTGQNQPPDWYTNPPAWLREPPPARRRERDHDDDDDRGYRSRGGRNDELEQAIRGMPEAVVSALKEAIQGATQQREAASQQQQAPPPQQQQTSNESSSGNDSTPRQQLTFADKWFGTTG
jgi:hypothetical protein